MAVFTAQLRVQHLKYVVQTDSNGKTVTDARGNPVGALAAPVTRSVVSIWRKGWEDPAIDRITVDFQGRTDADYLMLVPSADVNLYDKLDRVLINNGSEVLAYEVQGQSTSWTAGFPWTRYSALLSGEVHVRRVQ